MQGVPKSNSSHGGHAMSMFKATALRAPYEPCVAQNTHLNSSEGGSHSRK